MLPLMLMGITLSRGEILESRRVEVKEPEKPELFAF
jgi:hypothetical protein